MSLRICLSFMAVLWFTEVTAYPMDAVSETGIMRLEGYQMRLQRPLAGVKLPPPGARLGIAQIRLNMASSAIHLETLPPDPALQAELLKLLRPQQNNYSIAVLDFTDPQRPAYAEHRGDARFNPGSIGKLAVAAGLFAALARVYPDDTAQRLALLRETNVIATDLVLGDHHKVPFWHGVGERMEFRRLAPGDGGNLYTWLDWMLSASSNAAASMLIRETMLLNHFGRAYPLEPSRADAFFRETSREELSALLRLSLDDALSRSGLDLESLRQGGFFGSRARNLAAGKDSRATVRELMKYLLALQRGTLVDAFSSLELKRLLYMTQKRIRYASTPVLDVAAVYFKSGSFYRCHERTQTCPEYQGDRQNLLNSVVIVEPGPEGGGPAYMVVVSSDILRQNSSLAHQTLATRIHRLLQRRHQG